MQYLIWWPDPRGFPSNFGWDKPIIEGKSTLIFLSCMLVRMFASNNSFSFVGLFQCGIDVPSITTKKQNNIDVEFGHVVFMILPYFPIFFQYFPISSHIFLYVGHMLAILSDRQIRLTRKSELQLGIAPKGGAWHPKASVAGCFTNDRNINIWLVVWNIFYFPIYWE